MVVLAIPFRRFALGALLLVLALPVAARAHEANNNATVWAQTSAEYRALCRTVYRTAAHVIEERLRLAGYRRDEQGRLVDQEWARPVAYGSIRRLSRPVAVVMDLDETVIDNGPFQNYLLREEVGFSPELWARWVRYQAEETRAQRAVPGALEFIREVESRGVTVVYISNRDQSSFDATAKLLRALGVSDVDLEQRLLLQESAQEEEGGARALLHAAGADPDSSLGRFLIANRNAKARRQFEAMTRYRVLAWFGDNMFDFPVQVSPDHAAGRDMVEARRAAIEENAGRLGTEWFLLPNPMYGSWASSKTLPRGKWLEMLDDAGFGAYLKATAP